MQEEHYSTIQEPGYVYIGHVTPSSGSSKNISNSIISQLTDVGFSLNKLDAMGCDGTVSNMDWRTGITCLIEQQIKMPLQWGICLMQLQRVTVLAFIPNFRW